MTQGLLYDKLPRPDGDFVAYIHDDAASQAAGGEPVGVTWLGGFKSDMTGTKATAIADWVQRTGRSCTRFDYFGHGASSGDFAEGTIGRWRDDALAVLDEIASGAQVLVGSSMGGWIALLAALARPEKIKGLVLIAPAPDFTETLMWARFPDDIRRALLRDKIYLQPSAYDEAPTPITLNLIEEGRRHLLLEQPIALSCPVRILQGMADPDVPWEHALRLVDTLTSSDVTCHLSKSGDHRLSTPDDIAHLEATLDALLGQIEREPVRQGS